MTYKICHLPIFLKRICWYRYNYIQENILRRTLFSKALANIFLTCPHVITSFLLMHLLLQKIIIILCVRSSSRSDSQILTSFSHLPGQYISSLRTSLCIRGTQATDPDPSSLQNTAQQDVAKEFYRSSSKQPGDHGKWLREVWSVLSPWSKENQPDVDPFVLPDAVLVWLSLKDIDSKHCCCQLLMT